MNEEENIANNKMPSGTSRHQKLWVAILLILSTIVVLFWAASLRKKIYSPFNKNTTNSNFNLEESNEEEDLRNRDADKDELSDWDEVNVYNTSPYLEDSDSDGISDKKEIENSTNPNCPEGKDCTVQPQKNENDRTGEGLILNPSVGQSDANTGDVEKIFGGQSDAASLREMLLGSGMDKNILDQISDDDLMKSYQQTLNEQ